MHIKVFPFFGARGVAGLEALYLLLSLDFLERDWLVHQRFQVLLREHEADGLVRLYRLNLALPLRDVLEAGPLVHSDTDHEAVCVLILHLAIDAQMLVAARVVDLHVVLPLLHVLHPTVHVQHRRLILLLELVEQIVCNHGGFTDCRIADQDAFDFYRSCMLILDGRGAWLWLIVVFLLGIK